MDILVTGATGFIGRYLVQVLLDKGYHVTVVGRDKKKAQSMQWWADVDFICCDIHQSSISSISDGPKILIHLAWSELDDYNALGHIENTLPADFSFLRAMVDGGVEHLIVTGTCFEYGIHSGELNEDLPTTPATTYGLAKDSLRKFLQVLQFKTSFNLQWARLFYVYGPNQRDNTLFGQLDNALNNGVQTFNMSRGEQLRDYLHVTEVANRLALLLEHPECHGIINCCSGEPISVRRLVEQYLEKRKACISLNLGFYPYPDYEPLAFWGNSSKIDALQKNNVDT